MCISKVHVGGAYRRYMSKVHIGMCISRVCIYPKCISRVHIEVVRVAGGPTAIGMLRRYLFMDQPVLEPYESCESYELLRTLQAIQFESIQAIQ